MFLVKFFNKRILITLLLFCATVAILIGFRTQNGKINFQPAKSKTNKYDLIVELKEKALNGFAKLPLSFEENHGQTDKRVKFLSRGSGYSFFLGPGEATLALRKSDSERTGEKGLFFPNQESVLRLKLRGADAGAEVVGEEPLPGRSNYFVGKDSKDWHTDISNYAKVRVREVLPGIDQVYYGNQGQLEYDFIVRPEADPKDIKLSVNGAEKIEIAETGELVLTIGSEEVRQHKPVVYQETETGKTEVAGNYLIDENGEIGFEIGDYDRSKTLIIDPVLVYSSYFGGNHSDAAFNIVIDAEKNVYLTGTTSSTNFPSFNPIQPNKASSSFSDAFVAKINSEGTAIVYSTYLGGDWGEIGYGIDVDQTGSVYFTGVTGSNNFPTKNAYDSSFNGTDDIFLVKINPAGNDIVYSTYLGGDNTDIAYEVKVDKASGEAVLACAPFSREFPRTPGAFDQSCPQCPTGSFVTRFNSQGNAIINSTFVPASLYDLALDANGNIYITGSASPSIFPTTPGSPRITCDLCRTDAFIAKLNPSGTTLFYSTLFGGINDDVARSIAVDQVGNAYITGITGKDAPDFPPFPTTPGAFQRQSRVTPSAFVTKLNPSGTEFVYSTILSGSGASEAFGIAADSSGNAYVTGRGNIQSTFGGFPLKDPLAGAPGSLGGIFISVLNPSGSDLVFSSFLGGGTGRSVVTDNEGGVYITGETLYDKLLTSNAIQPNPGLGNSVRDAFFAKIRIDLGRRVAVPDFNGDNRADISVYRDGTWYLYDISKNSFNAVPFGLASDKLAPADYDGDGKTDIAVFRAGVWYLQRSKLGFTAFQWGQNGDVPMPADYDGDGRADSTIFRQGVWWIWQSSNNQFRAVQFGIASDKPVKADFDGDEKVDIAVYRGGTWYWLSSSDEQFHTASWGTAEDIPAPGDYDGDGKTDPAVFRPSSGTWYVLNLSKNNFNAFQWGASGDIPVAADYDGDGKTDYAVYRAGVWWIYNSAANNFSVQSFGVSSDIPVPAGNLIN